jgi:hypothetical protein
VRALQIASEWGVALFESECIDVNYFKNKVTNRTTIVAAESEMIPGLLNIFEDKNIISFETISSNKLFTPKDPIGLNAVEFKVEIAKVVYIAVRTGIQAIEGEAKRHLIDAIVPATEEDFEVILNSRESEFLHHDRISICVDFRAFIRQPINTGAILRFNPIGCDLNTFLNAPNGTIFIANHEHSNVESLMLRRSWIDLLINLSKYRKLNIITAPVLPNNIGLHDAYLAASAADNILLFQKYNISKPLYL